MKKIISLFQRNYEGIHDRTRCNPLKNSSETSGAACSGMLHPLPPRRSSILARGVRSMPDRRGRQDLQVEFFNTIAAEPSVAYRRTRCRTWLQN